MADGTSSNFIRKRDGRIVPFNTEKITDAIYKAAQAVGGSDRMTAQAISDSIIGILTIIYKDGRIPTVEKRPGTWSRKCSSSAATRRSPRHTFSTATSTGRSGRGKAS